MTPADGTVPVMLAHARPSRRSWLAGIVLLTAGPALLAGCGGGKPSEQEVHDGLVKFYTTNQHMSQESATKFADCVAPKFYGSLSAKTLKAMADGDPSQADSADANKLASLAADCANTG